MGMGKAAPKKRTPSWLLLTPPMGDCTMPMLGPLVLSQALKEKGIESFYFDASIELLWMTVEQRWKQCRGDKIKWLEHAVTVLSNHCKGVVFSLDEIKFPFSTVTLCGVARAVRLLEWLSCYYERMSFTRHLERGRWSHVGISVSYSSQLAPAVVLASHIRRTCPEINIVLGGAYFGNGSLDERKLIKAFSELDAIIVGPGESIMCSVADRNRKLVGVLSDWTSVKSYIPDLTCVQWSRYCVGPRERVVPFSFRKPCYYGKCVFCNGDSNAGCRTWSLSDVEKLTRQLLTVCVKNRVTSVYFTDAALPVPVLNVVAREIDGRIKWGCNVRAEHGRSRKWFGTLARGGCLMLRVGLETASQHVLDLMNKGVSASDFYCYFKNATTEGIRMHAYIMFGFPGESEVDRLITESFLRRTAPYIYSYSISIFHSIPGTAIHQELLRRFEYAEDSDVDVNQYYYSESSYAQLLRWVERVQITLTGVHTNRYCYSGRVFMVEPDIGVSTSVLQNLPEK